MIKLKNFFFKFLLIFFLTIIFLFVTAKSYSLTMFKNISSNFLRLHVIANSDSTEDQILKYKIRDEVLQYINPYFKDVKTKDEAIQILNSHITEISNLASSIAVSNGYSYPVSVSIGNFYFPTKEYSNITLPEGYYDALKIELGNATGQNWWCVMFPSLCLADNQSFTFTENSNDLLHENLSSEEYNIISNNSSTDLKFKFKLIELFENI